MLRPSTRADAAVTRSPRARTASEWPKGGAGQTIRFAMAPCSLGLVLVGVTERGICSIHLGDDDDGLAAGLAERFPKAALVPAGPELAEAAAQVAAFVDAPARGLDLPLDIRGTAFQHRVWSALRNIEVGERISYAELAMRVGSPRGSRAVAQACANNRIAVTIPCHRVVRGDGQLAGYRWGIARKRALLDLEARVSMTGAETESLP